MSYEIRKWVIKPVLKEVIGRVENKEQLLTVIEESMKINNYNSLEELKEKIEWEEY